MPRERCLTQDKSPANDKGFVSIETLCRAKTLDPTMQSVKDFVAAPNASLTSPLDLAEELLDSSATALRLIATVCIDKPCAGVVAEKLDVRTWAHLSRYFAFKLQAAVALQTYRTGGAAPSQPANQPENQQDAINQLLEAQKEWAQVVAITSSHLGWPSLGGKIFLLDCEGQTLSWHCGHSERDRRRVCCLHVTEVLAPRCWHRH